MNYIYFKNNNSWEKYNLDDEELSDSEPPSTDVLSEEILIRLFSYMEQENEINK